MYSFINYHTLGAGNNQHWDILCTNSYRFSLDTSAILGMTYPNHTCIYIGVRWSCTMTSFQRRLNELLRSDVFVFGTITYNEAAGRPINSLSSGHSLLIHDRSHIV